MRAEPVAALAAVLTIAGGVFVLTGGLLLWLVGTILAHLLGLSSLLFLGGVLLGVVTIVVGALIWLLPRAHRVLGAVALACAAASIPLAFGGLVLGFVLTAVGGAIAFARLRRTVVVVEGRPVAPGRSPPWT